MGIINHKIGVMLGTLGNDTACSGLTERTFWILPLGAEVSEFQACSIQIQTSYIFYATINWKREMSRSNCFITSDRKTKKEGAIFVPFLDFLQST
jgi:hypothetical protein